MRRAHVLTIAGIFFVMGCSPLEEPAPESDSQARDQITAAQRAWSDAFVRNDTAALMALYTEDAVLLPPGAEFRGRDGVREWLRAQAPGFVPLTHSTTPKELSIYDSIAVEHGRWQNSFRVGNGPDVNASDEYIVIWKRGVDGQWRFQYDMWHIPVTALTP
jgi:ketosteroid isomerase-like protein